MKRRKLVIKRCPVCESRLVGRLTATTFYCLNCEHEICLENSFINIFHILPDGTTTVVKRFKYCN